MQDGIGHFLHYQYAVDVVLCIDGTLAMNDVGNDGRSILDRVKGFARRIGTDICDTMNRRGKLVEQLRARIILFRDYLSDGNHAMMETDFFRLPQESTEFDACIDSIHAAGSRCELTDGLEALAYAIRSEWNTEYSHSRRVIIVLSNTGTHELGYGSKARNYPKGMAKNLAQLNDWWEEMTYSKRLLLFTPDENSWQCISDNWNNTFHFPFLPPEKWVGRDYEMILSCVANNI